MSAVDSHNHHLYSHKSMKDPSEALEIWNNCFYEATKCCKSDFARYEKAHIKGKTPITGEITEIINIVG